MATIKLYANPKKAKGLTKVYLRLTVESKHKFIPLDVYINPEHFNLKKMECKPTHELFMEINHKMIQKLGIAKEAMMETMDRNFSLEALAELIQSKLKVGGKAVTLITMRDDFIQHLKTKDSGTYHELVKTATESLKLFMGGDKLMRDIDVRLLTKYKEYLILRGCKPNTIRIYIRTVQRVFSYAIDKGIIPEELYPKKAGLLPSEEQGEYKDLPVEVMLNLIKIQPTLTGFVRKVADATLLQFYFQGCDLPDVIRGRKDQIVDGRYRFKRWKLRNKPNQPWVDVKVIPEAQAIIDSYPGELITDLYEGVYAGRSQYKTVYANFMDEMPKLEKLIGATKHITTKSMRDNWLTYSANLEINDHFRKKAVGHKDKSVTGSYTNIYQHRVDEANEIVTSLNWDSQVASAPSPAAWPLPVPHPGV